MAKRKLEEESLTLSGAVQNYKLSKEERETCIYYNEADDVWVASSSIRRHITKLVKNGWVEKENAQYHPDVRVFEGPRNAISIGNANKVKRVISDEERAIRSERMKASQANKHMEAAAE